MVKKLMLSYIPARYCCIGHMCVRGELPQLNVLKTSDHAIR